MSNARTRRRVRRRALWTAHDLAVVAAQARKWAYLLNDAAGDP